MVDEAVLDRLLRSHEAVAVDVLHDLLDRLTGVDGDQLGHTAGEGQHLLRLDLDVGRRAAKPGGALVDHELRVREGEALARCASGHDQCGRGHPHWAGPVFSALADPTRRQVVGYLAEHGETTATELAGVLPVTRQAVSKHLAALDAAGLVERRKAGREARYRLTPEPLSAAATWMAEVGARWDGRLAELRRHLGGAG